MGLYRIVLPKYPITEFPSRLRTFLKLNVELNSKTHVVMSMEAREKFQVSISFASLWKVSSFCENFFRLLSNIVRSYIKRGRIMYIVFFVERSWLPKYK